MKLPVNYNKMNSYERKAIRNEYVSLQKGLCKHCNSSLSEEPPKDIMSKFINWKLFPVTFQNYPVHLHHNHSTGMTIGAVHARCNAVLWQYHGE